jgi:hypothetical protein
MTFASLTSTAGRSGRGRRARRSLSTGLTVSAPRGRGPSVCSGRGPSTCGLRAIVPNAKPAIPGEPSRIGCALAGMVGMTVYRSAAKIIGVGRNRPHQGHSRECRYRKARLRHVGFSLSPYAGCIYLHKNAIRIFFSSQPQNCVRLHFCNKSQHANPQTEEHITTVVVLWYCVGQPAATPRHDGSMWRNRSALAMTLADENDIAKAAMAGESRMPIAG